MKQLKKGCIVLVPIGGELFIYYSKQTSSTHKIKILNKNSLHLHKSQAWKKHWS